MTSVLRTRRILATSCGDLEIKQDFLEVVEGIPTEVKAKTSEIRDLDLSIHSNSEDLEEQIRTFFSNAKKMKSGERASTFEKIRRQYYKLLEDADEKVGIASNLHDSLERYVRRIDVEIEKFKCELEADSPGITEVLERKSLEMDEPSKEINQKDVLRTSSYHPRNQGLSSFFGVPDWRQSFLVKKDDSNDPNLSSHLSLSPTSSSLSYGHIGGAGGSNAIAAAASQAIAATQQMRHGRRTASLAASYDAVTHGAADFCIGSELASAAKAALAASSLMQDPSPTSLSWAMSDAAAAATAAAPISVSGVAAPSSREVSSFIQSGSVGPHQQSNKRQKKNSNLLPKDSSVEDIPQDAVIDPFMESPDWTYDPNEPRYCVCNQVSYGNMVACDNRKCPLEWFHYACVGITAPPKGKWFCPQCSTSINRRQRK